MKAYYIGFSSLKNSNTDKIFEERKVIYGKSPMEAMKTEFPGKKITPIYGYDNQSFYSNVIIEECVVGEHGIKLIRGKKRNCYKVED